MPKIFIGDLSLEENKITSVKDLQKSLAEEGNVLLKLNHELGMEGVFDAISGVGKVIGTTAKVVSAPVRYGYKGAKLANKGMQQAGHAKKLAMELWTREIAPNYKKIITLMGKSLSRMYQKMVKLDKRYREVGIKVKTALTKLNLIDTVPETLLVLHNVEFEFLKFLTDIVSDFKTYMKTTTDSIKRQTRYIDPSEFATLVKTGDLDKIKDAVDEVESAISDYKGDSGGMKIVHEVYKNHGSIQTTVMQDILRFIKDITGQSGKKNDMTVSAYIKKLAIGEPESFNISTKSELTKLTTDYLSTVSSILNNSVIKKAFEGSGKSTEAYHKEYVKDVKSVFESVTDPKEPVERKTIDKPSDATDVIETPTVNKELVRYTSLLTQFSSSTSVAYNSILSGMLSSIYIIVTDTEKMTELIDRCVFKGKGGSNG